MNDRCLVWIRIGYNVYSVFKDYFVMQAPVIMVEDLDCHGIPSS